MPIKERPKPANFKNLSVEEQEVWYSERFAEAEPDATQMEMTTPSPSNSSSSTSRRVENIRDWSTTKFGIPGERLRNCILYQLDHAKNAWYRESGISIASMGRENFVRKLDADTPVGWTPENGNTKRPAKPLPDNIVAWLMMGPGVNAPVGGFVSAREKLNAIKRSWYGYNSDWESQPDPDIEWEAMFEEHQKAVKNGSIKLGAYV